MFQGRRTVSSVAYTLHRQLAENGANGLSLGKIQDILAKSLGYESWNNLAHRFPARKSTIAVQRTSQQRNFNYSASVDEACAVACNIGGEESSATAALRDLADNFETSVSSLKLLPGYQRDAALEHIGYRQFSVPLLHIAYTSEAIGEARAAITISLAPLFFVSIGRVGGGPQSAEKYFPQFRITTQPLDPTDVRCDLTTPLREVLAKAYELADIIRSRLSAGEGQQ